MRRWLAGLVVLAAVLAGCSTTVHGTGHVVTSGPRVTPTTPAAPPTGPPGGSATVPPAATTCPHISYPYAHLKFDCVTTGMTSVNAAGQVWPLNLQKSVEPDWALSEGAGRWGPTDGQSLEAITKNLRSQMVAADAYGTKPGIATTSSKSATVAGVRGWVLQTTFTINSAFRTKQKLKVKVEKSWIVAITVGADDVSLWYVTVPDDVQKLWATVPSIIDTIKLS